MGLLSPAAYDALLLEKVKLVIQAVMQDPARKTQAMTYEDFVVGFDVAQPLSFKLFDLLMQETAKRRLPRRTYVPGAAAPSTSSAAGPATARRPRSSRAHSPDPIDMLTGGDATSRERSSRLTDLFNDPLVAVSADPRTGPSTARRRTDVARYGFEQLLAREAQAAGAPASSDDDISPSTRLRQRQLDELFGPSHPSRDGLDELMGIYNEDGEPLSSAAIFERASAAGPLRIVNRDGGSDLPTYEELWTILVDEPFPHAEISSYFSFRIALNSTAQFMTSPVRAPGLHELLEELAERDLAFPIRLLNIRAQRARRAATSTREVAEPAADVEVGPPAPEGIWRASFVEHLEDGSTRDVPVSLGTLGSHGRADAGEAPDAFSAFAERRRAERRARTGGAADRHALAAGGHLAASIDSPAGASASASASSNAGTPVVTVSNATTPATSAGQSPQASSSTADLRAELSELCPQSVALRSPPPRPPRPAETSASLAEAHFRQQRAIAPLPSHRPTPEREIEASEASRVRTTIPDDILVRVREGVEAGQLEYDPTTGWTGQGVDGFLPEQLDVVARALVQLRRLRIRGSDHGGVEIEF